MSFSGTVTMCSDARKILVFSYKLPIPGLTQEWFRELPFSGLECGVHDRLHIYPPVWDVLLPLA